MDESAKIEKIEKAKIEKAKHDLKQLVSSTNLQLFEYLVLNKTGPYGYDPDMNTLKYILPANIHTEVAAAK